MPRGVKKEVTYTGKAAKINEKILKLEADLKAAKEELKAAYKEQLKEEKIAAKEAEKAKKEGGLTGANCEKGRKKRGALPLFFYR